MSNLIRPSLDFEILFTYEEPVQGFILKILHLGLLCGTGMTTR